jgi:anti-sigma B factor antagonist
MVSRQGQGDHVTNFEVRQRGDTITVTGELDLATAPELQALLDGIEGPDTVTVDLGATTFVDSQGLATLTAAKQRLDGRLRIIGAQDNVRRVFEITKLDSVLLDD